MSHNILYWHEVRMVRTISLKRSYCCLCYQNVLNFIYEYTVNASLHTGFIKKV
jgi:hypothetical protein